MISNFYREARNSHQPSAPYFGNIRWRMSPLTVEACRAGSLFPHLRIKNTILRRNMSDPEFRLFPPPSPGGDGPRQRILLAYRAEHGLSSESAATIMTSTF